ncbi:MAG: hypothetical protein KDA78_05665 [Planctomycetaceae bacterium]|nr:hypothetical protein [Planctomycetaceae bacterium]
MTTDRQREPGMLDDRYLGAHANACWLVGSGPSLTREMAKQIGETPVPVMGMNLAGTGLMRPTFWTSYDPTCRFLRSVYQDAGITKFVNVRRAMDLVPETTFKVCDCPNLFFFEGERERGFADFADRRSARIVDWNDTMVQALEILIRLGFRLILLAGCEMRVRASEAQIGFVRMRGGRVDEGASLSDLMHSAKRVGISSEELAHLNQEAIYHFDEQKRFGAAVATDAHYFRVSQYLRLSQRALSRAGVRIISVTPNSRLNDYFPVWSVDRVQSELNCEYGNPATEVTMGKYSLTGPRLPDLKGPMRDFLPLHWSGDGDQKQDADEKVCLEERFDDEAEIDAGYQERAEELRRLKKAEVVIDEVG